MQKMRMTLVMAVVGLAGASVALADLYDPPPGYYDSATSTVSATLSSQLHNIIDGHIERTYDDARVALQILDADANDPTKMVLIYNGQLVDKQWDGGTTWNREHTWPRSRGVDTTGPDNSDLHMLRPCNSSVNGSRGNLPFGTAFGFWDPSALGAADRGEIARTQMYADVRYDGGESATTDLTLVNGTPSGAQMGDLDEMLEWHYAYGPDERERRRNYLIWTSDVNAWFDPEVSPVAFTVHQGNRNPFVDRPEYAWVLWGSGPNNSTLYVGGSPDGAGASSIDVDYGSVIEGAALAPSVVPIERSGTHPTAYRVSVSGGASSPQAGLPLTYASTTGPVVPQPTVSVSLATGVPGDYSGTVTIDNVDMTSAGAGMGSADGDDVINVLATVLGHANPSFNSPSDTNVVNLDFGDVPQNSGASLPIGISVHNLGGAFTARLDLDSIDGVGDTSVLTTTLAPFTNLDAGSSNSFQVELDTFVAQGNYAATYTLNLSDEDLAGEAGHTLTLNVMAAIVPPAGCDGDLDGDLDTDVFDFNIFAPAFGSTGLPPFTGGDFDGDGDVDVFDFNIFAFDFGCVP